MVFYRYIRGEPVLLLLQPALLTQAIIHRMVCYRPAHLLPIAMADSNYQVAADVMNAEHVWLRLQEREVLKGAFLQAARGQICGLLGRNGEGKSLLLQCIFGTREAEECDLFVNGVKTRQAYTQDGLVNYLPQMPFIPPGKRLATALREYGVAEHTVIQLFPELAARLTDKAGDLAGGTERLFAALLVLLAPTRFTLLDEPFTHIMPLYVERLCAVILQQKVRKGIIITDHQHAVLRPLCDTLYLLKGGRTIRIREDEDLVLHGYIGA